MARTLPKDFDFYVALHELPEKERKVVMAYVFMRTCVKGCEPEKMSPVELVQWMMKVPEEQDAA